MDEKDYQELVIAYKEINKIHEDFKKRKAPFDERAKEILNYALKGKNHKPYFEGANYDLESVCINYTCATCSGNDFDLSPIDVPSRLLYVNNWKEEYDKIERAGEQEKQAREAEERKQQEIREKANERSLLAYLKEKYEKPSSTV